MQNEQLALGAEHNHLLTWWEEDDDKEEMQGAQNTIHGLVSPGIVQKLKA